MKTDIELKFEEPADKQVADDLTNALIAVVELSGSSIGGGGGDYYIETSEPFDLNEVLEVILRYTPYISLKTVPKEEMELA